VTDRPASVGDGIPGCEIDVVVGKAAPTPGSRRCREE